MCIASTTTRMVGAYTRDTRLEYSIYAFKVIFSCTNVVAFWDCIIMNHIASVNTLVNNVMHFGLFFLR